MQEIVSFNCRALVSTVPFFADPVADPDFVNEILSRLRHEVFLPNDVIVRHGAVGNRMYLIDSGIVEVVSRRGDVVTCLSDGSYFGGLLGVQIYNCFSFVKSVEVVGLS